MNITAKQWEQITTAVHGKAARFFKPKENLVILDFIQTAKEDILTVVSEINEQETQNGSNSEMW